jgi:hypothetical protein
MRALLAIFLMLASLMASAQTIENENEALSDLSHMFFEDDAKPTYGRQYLDRRKLDFSVESLKHVDEYLEEVRKHKDVEKDRWIRLVLRTGAYVGEVIRRNDTRTNWQWIEFETAKSVNPKLFGNTGKSIAVAAVLYDGKGGFAFPLAKVVKRLDNGEEDSVYFFAQVIIAK